MRHLLELRTADVYTSFHHHDFVLAEEQRKPEAEAVPSPSSSSSSSSGSSRSGGGARVACNKQTINAGDNPCPSFQSPLPYMLAGLAAMVLLVVISLMILACSYLRGYFSGEEQGGDSSGASAAAGGGGGNGGHLENGKAAGLFASHDGIGNSPEKIVVILAGQDKPTHLAQPVELGDSKVADLENHEQQILTAPPPPGPSLNS